ncbi:hypothetical protein GCM10009107_45410 [Ideonella azotifigens]|uniref:Uncharacterized protein n=1 Tax=Ideonella azotifigens TaxID=513160 RepID=A0ABN1KBR3_9BURK|nr:hypothetical protein [Ideonella azotifigens]
MPLEPLDLRLGIGHWQPAGPAEQVKDLLGWNTEAIDETASDQARSTNSGTAMDRHGLSREKTRVELFYEARELSGGSRRSAIRDRKRPELDLPRRAQCLLVLEAKFPDFRNLQQRNHHVDAGHPPCIDFRLKIVVASRASHQAEPMWIDAGNPMDRGFKHA